MSLYEPILDPAKSRLTTFPIEYKDLWKMYKKQFAAMWKSDDIDMSDDYKDFISFNDDEKYFLKKILAFFAASDGIVNFNIRERFSNDVKIYEAQVVYAFQQMMENVHGEVYSMMLDNFVKDPDERNSLFNAIENDESIKLMKDWAFKWIESGESFSHRLIAFAIIEGVFFCGCFAAIFWFKLIRNKSKNVLKGLVQANEYIQRDETSHCDFACRLYHHIVNKLSSDDVYKIMDEAVKIAQNFMTVALPVKLIGMNNALMAEYIEYIGDRLLVDLGYSKLYQKKNPFEFMDTIGMAGRTNFFEGRNTVYQFAGKNSELEMSDDF